MRLTLNSDEVEGRSATVLAASTISGILRRCQEAGLDATTTGRLELTKQQGQLIAPVYSSWGRRTQIPTTKKGPLHVKMFVIGPRERVPPQEDTRTVILRSPNWTVSSEANVELSVALAVGSDGAAGVDHVVRDLRHGAVPVTAVVDRSTTTPNRAENQQRSSGSDKARWSLY